MLKPRCISDSAMADTSAADIIRSSLAELHRLRHSANTVFRTAAEGVMETGGEETKEKKFLSTLKQQIDTVQGSLASVETQLGQVSGTCKALRSGSCHVSCCRPCGRLNYSVSARQPAQQ